MDLRYGPVPGAGDALLGAKDAEMSRAKLSRYVDSIGEECFFILCARVRPASKWVKEYPSRGALLVRTLLRAYFRRPWAQTDKDVENRQGTRRPELSKLDAKQNFWS
jgi:hypothetical protein